MAFNQILNEIIKFVFNWQRVTPGHEVEDMTLNAVIHILICHSHCTLLVIPVVLAARKIISQNIFLKLKKNRKD
jgi:hypothetical protein